MPGVVVLPTGAWYDPASRAVPGTLELHGNPNVLTLDKGSSRLAQAPVAHSCLVEVERFAGEAPRVARVRPAAVRGGVSRPEGCRVRARPPLRGTGLRRARSRRR